MAQKARGHGEDWRSGHGGAGDVAWRSGRGRPLIGITADLAEPQPGKLRATCAMTYCRAVAEAGGIPVVLAPLAPMAPEHARRLDGFVLSGGDDPRTEAYGEPTHPKATPVHPERQAYETELLLALDQRRAAPVLGVCLGMQMMALVAGGKLVQHLPDEIPTAAAHTGDAEHGIRVLATDILPASTSAPGQTAAVTSHHHQAVREPGRLRIAAEADDGVIEAIDDPSRPFYLGVQWHPERTPARDLGVGLFIRLVEAARRTPQD